MLRQACFLKGRAAYQLGVWEGSSLPVSPEEALPPQAESIKVVTAQLYSRLMERKTFWRRFLFSISSLMLAHMKKGRGFKKAGQRYLLNSLYFWKEVGSELLQKHRSPWIYKRLPGTLLHGDDFFSTPSDVLWRIGDKSN